MSPRTPSKSRRAKVVDPGAHPRAQGLRPIVIWAPDVSAPSFRAEARRQSRIVASSEHAREDQAFIDAVSHIGEP